MNKTFRFQMPAHTHTDHETDKELWLKTTITGYADELFKMPCDSMFRIQTDNTDENLLSWSSTTDINYYDILCKKRPKRPGPMCAISVK